MPIAALWPLPAPVPGSIGATAPSTDYGAADFAAALQALLPQGRAWPREPGATQTRLWAGIGRFRARLHARQRNLLADAWPPSTYELLPEWEASLGLPDPCIGVPASMSMRRALVSQRLAARGLIEGSQSAAFLIAAAALLGITVTVGEFADAVAGRAASGAPAYGAVAARPFRWAVAGEADAGDPIADWSSFTPAGDWAFALRITAVAAIDRFALAGQAVAGDPIADWSAAAVTTIRSARAGQAVAGDPVAEWANAPLECSLRRLLPAHVVPIFAYAATYEGVPLQQPGRPPQRLF